MVAYLDQRGRKVSAFKDNLPGNDWARSFLRRHSGTLTTRLCQNIKVARSKVDCNAVSKYFQNLSETLKDVDPAQIVNYDETNLSDDPGAVKFLFKRGTRYPERIMNSTKTCVSIMFAGTATGELLAPYVVYKAEAMWETWRQGGPDNCRYNRSKSGWFDSTCFHDWFQTVIIPWARRRDGRKVVIGDNLSSHFTFEVLQSCEKYSIAFVCLPPNATHLMQPLDVSFYAPLKRAWRQILTSWKSTDGKSRASLPKDQFPPLLKKLIAKIEPNVKTNLVSGFRTCGIVPCDSAQVLKKLPSSNTCTSASAEMNTEGTPVKSGVSAAVMSVLQKMRYGDKDDAGTLRRPRRKVNVEPGKSVASTDISNTGNGAVPSTSAKSQVAIRKKVRYEDDVEQTSSDSGSDMNSSSASSDNEDTDTGNSTGAGSNTSSKQQEEADSSGEEQSNSEQRQTEESAPEQQINKGAWIVAEYRLKKSIRWYAGQVTDKSDDGLHVKFLRCETSAGTALKRTFHWPSIEDSDVIEQECVKQILSEPTTDRRGHVNFSDNFIFQCS